MKKQKSIPDRLLRFTMLIAAGWAICFWPAKMFQPEHGVYWMSVATIGTLVPGWMIVLSERLAIFRNDLILILGQMAIRVVAMLTMVVVVRIKWPDIGLKDYYAWLIVFYGIALFYEAVLLTELVDSRPISLTPTSKQTSS